MTLRFSCRCGRKLKANTSSAGTTSFCPGCGETLQVPDGAAAAEVQVAAVHVPNRAETKRYPPRPKNPRRPRMQAAPLPAHVETGGKSVFVQHRAPDGDARERRALARFEATCEMLDGVPHLFRISGGLAVLSALALFLYPRLLIRGETWVNGWLMALVHFQATTVLLGYGARYLDDVLDTVLFAGRHRFTLDLDPLAAWASLLRWGGSVLCGPILFALAAIRHWLRCGDPTAVDGLILLELGTAGATWWMMSALVLARRPELVWVSPAQAFNAAWRLGPRALLAGLMLALVVGFHAWLASAAATRMLSGLSGFMLLWLVWFSGWWCTAFVLRVTGAWYHDSRRQREVPTYPTLAPGCWHTSGSHMGNATDASRISFIFLRGIRGEVEACRSGHRVREDPHGFCPPVPAPSLRLPDRAELL